MIQDNRPRHSPRDIDEIFGTTLRSARNLAALESHQLFVHQEWSNLHLKKKEKRKKRKEKRKKTKENLVEDTCKNKGSVVYFFFITFFEKGIETFLCKYRFRNLPFFLLNCHTIFI